MPTPPNWEPAVNGGTTFTNAINHAAQTTQFLGSHPSSLIYSGNQMIGVSGNSIGTNFGDLFLSSTPAFDLSQKFVMPGGKTTIGRLTVPVVLNGNGAGFQVSLYPDNGSGNPDTTNLLASTTVPASWVTNLGAPFGIPSGGPLANPQFNTTYVRTGAASVPWSGPAGDASGVALNPTIVTSGNFAILLGGSTSSPVSGVNIVQFMGSGLISKAMAAPSLPEPTNQGAAAVTSTSIVVMGGNTGSGDTAKVWVAGWNSGTGQLGSWSAQANLPVTLTQGSAASFNDTVYYIGGFASGSNTVSTVYYSKVNNGQITSWTTGPALPQPLINTMVAALNGWVIVAGGRGVGPSFPTSNAVYYSQINPDGSLGPWLTGPSLPTGVSANFVGWDTVVTDSAFIVVGGSGVSLGSSQIQSLAVGPSGIGDQWYLESWRKSASVPLAYFPLGNGAWQIVDIDIQASQYVWANTGVYVQVPVPLSASGLTPGNSYHIVFQQQASATTTDNIQFTNIQGTGNPDMLRSNRHANSWSVLNSGFTLPLYIYDASVGGAVIHTWEDPTVTGSNYTSNQATRHTTLPRNAKNQIMGVCEATIMPNDPLDSNPTFTSGTAPWTATNCTFVQSSAQVHGGFPFSGLMTPNGTSASVFVTSEKFPVNPGTTVTNGSQWYSVNGWVYSPPGYSSVSLSVVWYDSGNNVISTSSKVVSVPAATWTNLVNYFLPPATAAQASIQVTESGTPPASATLYLSNITFKASLEQTQTLAPVTSVTYANGIWPATSFNRLN